MWLPRYCGSKWVPGSLTELWGATLHHLCVYVCVYVSLCLIRWILVGSEEQLQTKMRNRTVDRSALTIGQNIMYAFKSKRQVQHIPKKASDTFQHHTYERIRKFLEWHLLFIVTPGTRCWWTSSMSKTTVYDIPVTCY